MIYLNVILTVLCVILLSFLVGILYFWKKYGKKLMKFGKNTPSTSELPKIGDPKQMEESMKMIGNLLKNMSK